LSKACHQFVYSAAGILNRENGIPTTLGQYRRPYEQNFDRDSVTEIFTTHDHSEPARTGGQEPVSPHRSTPNKSGRPKAALIVSPHVLSFTQALYCATALITPNVPA
jgi:hypothetical protein